MSLKLARLHWSLKSGLGLALGLLAVMHVPAVEPGNVPSASANAPASPASAASNPSPAPTPASGAANTPVPAKPTPQAPLPTLSELRRSLDCAQVLGAGAFPTFSWFMAKVSPAAFTGATPEPGTVTPAKAPAVCPDRPNRDLIGNGQVIVNVKQADYALARKVAGGEIPEAAPSLVLNGFNLGGGGRLISAEPVGDEMVMRFLVEPHKDSTDFWSSVYAEKGLMEAASARVAVGFKGVPVFFAQSEDAVSELRVGVAKPQTVAWAFSFAAVLVALFVWVARGSDALRVTPSLTWWNDAHSLRRQVRGELGDHVPTWLSWLSPRRRLAAYDIYAAANPGAGAPTFTMKSTVLTLLQSSPYGATFKVDDIPACLQAAASAGAGNLPAPGDGLNRAVVGYAIRPVGIRVVRSAFSLASVQVAVWVLFSVVSGVFLWTVFGDFPPLQPTLLALVTVSAATAGASWLVDSAPAGGRAFEASQGFLRDLVSGVDGNQQVHRFQSLVVNLLLLGVGVVFVVQRLSYPTFDPTWLGFLGISGLTLAVGKQFKEAPK